MSNKKNAAQEAAVNTAARPAMYSLVAAIGICVLAPVLLANAPDLFNAVGGWLTVFGLLLVISVWAGLAIARRTNKNVARMEEEERGSDG